MDDYEAIAEEFSSKLKPSKSKTTQFKLQVPDDPKPRRCSESARESLDLSKCFDAATYTQKELSNGRIVELSSNYLQFKRPPGTWAYRVNFRSDVLDTDKWGLMESALFTHNIKKGSPFNYIFYGNQLICSTEDFDLSYDSEKNCLISFTKLHDPKKVGEGIQEDIIRALGNSQLTTIGDSLYNLQESVSSL